LESDHCSFLWTRHSTQNKIQIFWKALALNTQRGCLNGRWLVLFWVKSMFL
jgi:hypothetical protein